MTEATYRAESALRPGHDGSTLVELETALGATPGGLVERPRFFSGMLARPAVAAAALLAVADVAGSRYADASVGKLRNLDPVVTASGDRLRFESFSLDNGVHARLDLLADGVDGGDIAFGTTNVDVNAPLRLALAGVAAASLVHLDVGTDGLEVATLDATHVERRVHLPDRWVRGFAETSVAARGMRHVATLPGAAAAAWLASLPKAAPGPSYHLVPGPTGLRQSLRPAPGSVRLAGAARLGAALRFARHASALDVYAGADGTSGWVWTLPGARVTLLLSPEPWRGFSGEGGLLGSLAAAGVDDWAARLLDHLAWDSRIDPAALGRATGLEAAQVGAAIDWLAVSGKVGYDLVDEAWYHRELPLALDRVEGDNPRLAAARALVEQGAVHAVAGRDRWEVRSGDHAHWVDLDGGELRCTCLWWARHRGLRGPCKHVLAVRLLHRPAGG